MTKILTIIGTRPEIIRLSRIIPKLDKVFNNILVHTGQNYDFELDKIFFNELKVRKPDYYLAAKGSFAKQLAIITSKLETIIIKEKPKKFVVLGDTNSSLGAIVARRLGLKVYHLEAGNRSYLKNSPEEINRRIIDHISNINMTYTYKSCDNLLSEGIKKKNIFVIGNPITEVINYYKKKINSSKILNKLKISPNNYVVCTLHREENVDRKEKFSTYIKLLNLISDETKIPIIFSVHPRTKKKIKKFNITLSKKIILIKPLGFFDFSKLEFNSKFLITDSGTVQEEASIYRKLCLVFRDSTERPETIKNGDALLLNKIINKKKLKKILNINLSPNTIKEYRVPNVSQITLKIIKSNLEN